MKKIYNIPQINIDYFEMENVITGSGIENDVNNGNITFNGQDAKTLSNFVSFEF